MSYYNEIVSLLNKYAKYPINRHKAPSATFTPQLKAYAEQVKKQREDRIKEIHYIIVHKPFPPKQR